MLSFFSARWRSRRTGPAVQRDVSSYWTGHVVARDEHATRAESLDFLSWRNSLYLGYAEQMPVGGADGLAVLDFGCGPGNDLVGFREFSQPARLIGMDVSQTALDLAARRMRLHGDVELIRLPPDATSIPLSDASVDLVHSSGVLHHTPDPTIFLREFRRILRPDGYAQIMVYNRRSVWFHLYAGYIWRIENHVPFEADQVDVFRRTTDGAECPVSYCYTAEEFAAMGAAAGFRVEHVGNCVDIAEIEWLQRHRGDALRERRLPDESRRFLYSLTFDQAGRPLHDGQVAGINASFRFYPI
jgi:ubiquinone/menaquinone biosynthesis C-methylase UbiE